MVKKGTVNKKAKKSKLSVKYVLQQKSSIANYEIYDDIVSVQDFLSSMEKVGISKDEFSLLEFHTEALSLKIVLSVLFQMIVATRRYLL